MRRVTSWLRGICAVNFIITDSCGGIIKKGFVDGRVEPAGRVEPHGTKWPHCSHCPLCSLSASLIFPASGIFRGAPRLAHLGGGLAPRASRDSATRPTLPPLPPPAPPCLSSSAPPHAGRCALRGRPAGRLGLPGDGGGCGDYPQASGPRGPTPVPAGNRGMRNRSSFRGGGRAPAAGGRRGWQGREGSPTRDPRPATPGEMSYPRPATPSDPGPDRDFEIMF